jgi:hypothetical protein
VNEYISASRLGVRDIVRRAIARTLTKDPQRPGASIYHPSRYNPESRGNKISIEYQ